MAICNYETVRGNEAKYVTFWTDNPVLDADRYSAAGDAFTEATAPICNECGKPIYSDYTYMVYGNDPQTCICKDCVGKLREHIKKMSPYLADIVDIMFEDHLQATPVVEEEENAWI